jgi:predicted nicotinamide N-methyase
MAIGVYEYSNNITIQQDPTGELKAGTGATIWDSCLVLCKYFERQNEISQPKNILELGAGTGLLSIVLSKKFPQSNIITTDISSVLSLLKENVCNSNATNITVQELDWMHPKKFNEEFDLIVMSDTITWPELYEPLLKTLELVSTPNTTLIFAHESRNFEKEAKFYSKLSSKFTFVNIKAEELDPIYQSEDIFVFKARYKSKQ